MRIHVKSCGSQVCLSDLEVLGRQSETTETSGQLSMRVSRDWDEYFNESCISDERPAHQSRAITWNAAQQGMSDLIAVHTTCDPSDFALRENEMRACDRSIGSFLSSFFFFLCKVFYASFLLRGVVCPKWPTSFSIVGRDRRRANERFESRN
jgi:hypothetical protein